ncbi:hypothetical protein HDU93_008736 [Gonapodya sp. JEL0774]|nr:hypothetical protein HDU93_008736 [Gonapodya sp. JEL0774]
MAAKNNLGTRSSTIGAIGRPTPNLLSKPNGDALAEDQIEHTGLSLGKAAKFEGMDHLDSLLASRPQKQDLLDRNILKGDVSAGIQAAAAELAKRKVEDVLSKKLHNRPEPAALVQSNVLKSDPTSNSSVSSAIQGPQVELQKKKIEDALVKQISRRPSAAELVQSGVLKLDPTAPSALAGSLQSAALQLQQAQKEDNLKEFTIAHRERQASMQ